MELLPLVEVLAPPAIPGWPIESLALAPPAVRLVPPMLVVVAVLLVVAPVGLLVVAPVVGIERGAAVPAPVVVDVEGVLLTALEFADPGLPGLAVPGLAAAPPVPDAEPEPELEPPLWAWACSPSNAALASNAAIVTSREFI